jgi:hypothetical protein
MHGNLPFCTHQRGPNARCKAFKPRRLKLHVISPHVIRSTHHTFPLGKYDVWRLRKFEGRKSGWEESEKSSHRHGHLDIGWLCALSPKRDRDLLPIAASTPSQHLFRPGRRSRHLCPRRRSCLLRLSCRSCLLCLSNSPLRSPPRHGADAVGATAMPICPCVEGLQHVSLMSTSGCHHQLAQCILHQKVRRVREQIWTRGLDRRVCQRGRRPLVLKSLT